MTLVISPRTIAQRSFDVPTELVEFAQRVLVKAYDLDSENKFIKR